MPVRYDNIPITRRPAAVSRAPQAASRTRRVRQPRQGLFLGEHGRGVLVLEFRVSWNVFRRMRGDKHSTKTRTTMENPFEVIIERLDRIEKLLIKQQSGSEIATTLQDLPDKKYVYGLTGLAELLGCSHPTAQKIKNSGRIPYTQVGRKLVFDCDAVLNSLAKKK